MKKIILIVITAVVAFIVFKCCIEPQKYVNTPMVKLKGEIEKLNMLCPIDMGIMGKFQSAQYDFLNDTVYFKYLINEPVRKFMVNDREKSLRSAKLFLLQDKEKTVLGF